MEQVLADLCRELPSAHVFCAFRLTSESFCAAIESDDELWRARMRAFLSFVAPRDYPPEFVKNGYISVVYPEENTETATESIREGAAEEAGEKEDADGGDEREREKKSPPPPPTVTVLVQGRDREICEAFIKHATQTWAIEYVLRSWRREYLRACGPMIEFWNQKWNERQNVDIHATQSNDPIVNNRQIDIDEMVQLCGDARHSVAIRVQNDTNDHLIEEYAERKAQKEANEEKRSTEKSD